jgi:hypothetical protein
MYIVLAVQYVIHITYNSIVKLDICYLQVLLSLNFTQQIKKACKFLCQRNMLNKL